MSVLDKATVLVLNRSWQAINIRTPEQAFCQMATDVATALHIDGEEMFPVKWEDWLKLPVREGDNSVKTTHGLVRVPTVIVLANYSKVPTKRPTFSKKAVAERDGHRDQYTGELIEDLDDANLDHVLPRSRGGETTWTNIVLVKKSTNSKKANKTPQEAGLRLIKTPTAPKEVPVTAYLRNQSRIKDWDHFLVR